VSERIPFVDLGPWVERVRRAGDDREFTAGGVQSFLADVRELLDSNEFLGGGPTTKKLEATLSAKLGVANVVTCANGTDALQLALRACGIDRGSRVAMPNVTFWATYEAIVNVGATPVLIDINPDDRQMDFDEFVRAHDAKRFDAAILVHLYGWCSSALTEYRVFCRKRHITLIEDGAQAFGVTVDGQSVFADADIATLSFHPAKVLGAIGDGGAVLTKTTRVADRVRALGNHGRVWNGRHQHVAAGWNSRMDAIQAAWLLRGLDVIDEVIEERRRLRDLYVTRLTEELLGAKPEAAARSPSYPGIQTNGYMTTLSMDRSHPDKRIPADVIIQHLAAVGIEARRIYPYTIADQSHHNAIEVGALYHSRRLTDHVVSLPLYYGMPEEYVERCVKAYVEAVK